MHILFCDHLLRMIGGSVLSNYETPKGTARPELPVEVKLPHADGRLVTPGLVEYKGDEPFRIPTAVWVNQLGNSIGITQLDMNCRTLSVAEAIRDYIPSELFFDEFLPYFLDNIHFRSHQDWINLNNIPLQFNVRNPGDYIDPDILQYHMDLKDSDAIRTGLTLSPFRAIAYQYPEMLFAFTIFIGTHPAYLGHLNKLLFEIWADNLLTNDDEQRSNMRTVLEHPFKQFDSFIIMGTLLQSVLENMHANKQPGDVAIDHAWEKFWEHKLLRRTFDTGDIMMCPAHRHLRETSKRKTIQTIYQFVLDNKGNPVIDRMLQRTTQKAIDAIVNQEYWSRQQKIQMGRDAHEKLQRAIARLTGLFPETSNSRGLNSLLEEGLFIGPRPKEVIKPEVNPTTGKQTYPIYPYAYQ